MEVYVIEYAIEKKDGTVRFESFDYQTDRGLNRLRIEPKLKAGETLIYFSGQYVQTLV